MKKISEQVKTQMSKNQRDYYLGEQIKAMQKEMGQGESDITEIEARIAKAKLPKHARTKVQSELRKLKSMPPMSAEATVVRNYLDCVLNIPWRQHSNISSDIAKARATLDAAHYGLTDVKEKNIGVSCRL